MFQKASEGILSNLSNNIIKCLYIKKEKKKWSHLRQREHKYILIISNIYHTQLKVRRIEQKYF